MLRPVADVAPLQILLDGRRYVLNTEVSSLTLATICVSSDWRLKPVVSRSKYTTVQDEGHWTGVCAVHDSGDGIPSVSRSSGSKAQPER